MEDKGVYFDAFTLYTQQSMSRMRCLHHVQATRISNSLLSLNSFSILHRPFLNFYSFKLNRVFFSLFQFKITCFKAFESFRQLCKNNNFAVQQSFKNNKEICKSFKFKNEEDKYSQPENISIVRITASNLPPEDTILNQAQF